MKNKFLLCLSAAFFTTSSLFAMNLLEEEKTRGTIQQKPVAKNTDDLQEYLNKCADIVIQTHANDKKRLAVSTAHESQLKSRYIVNFFGFKDENALGRYLTLFFDYNYSNISGKMQFSFKPSIAKELRFLNSKEYTQMAWQKQMDLSWVHAAKESYLYPNSYEQVDNLYGTNITFQESCYKALLSSIDYMNNFRKEFFGEPANVKGEPELVIYRIVHDRKKTVPEESLWLTH